MPPRDVELEAALPIDEHARLVMAWRNDPLTRAASFHGQEKTWPAFRDEYLGWFADPVVPAFFGVVPAEADRAVERVGFARFRRCAVDGSGAIDISVNVAPEWRGRGVGRSLIALATARAIATEPRVLAEIKPGNAASVRAFVLAGYARIANGVHDVDGTAVPVERYLFVRDPEHGGR